ncbi:MAG TPA: antitoxin family protein [Pyrinomonadaceae bacterium]|jgi:predicted DNA-binding antitoxin AbrB/MazE fold protein
MNQTIQAIYENGILRPLQPLDLPEGSIVEIEIIKILGDSTEFIKNIEKDLSDLEETEGKHLEKEIDA